MFPLRFYVFAAGAICAAVCLSGNTAPPRLPDRRPQAELEDSTPVLVIPPENVELGVAFRAENALFTAGETRRNLQAPVHPALAAEWDQRWTDAFGTFTSFELRSEAYDRPADLGLIQYETAAVFPRAGARVFLAEKQELSVAAGAGQRFFASGIDDTNIAIERLWIPELRMGTRNRLWRFGDSDLVFNGTISALGPALSESLASVEAHPGFGQSAGLFVERAVHRADLAGVGLQYEYESQGTNGLDRRSLSVSLGAYYGLSFLN